MTALHIACAKGYIDVMTLLLDYNNAWLAQGKKFPKTLKEANLRNMVNEYTNSAGICTLL